MSDTGPSIAEASKSAYLPIVLGLLRGLMAMASAFGFTWALTVTADQLQMAATAAVMLGTLVWSAWQKVEAVRASRKAQVAAAVASVEKGVPVTVVETAAGQPNVVTAISRAEAATAPVVPVGPPVPAPRLP